MMRQVVTRLSLLLACACAASPVHAACNLIPGTEKTFDSALGATNRPFAAPGEPLEVRLRPCDTASTAMPGGFTAPASDYVVTVVFRSATAGRNAVVISTDCSFFTAPVEAACESSLGGGAATCVQVAGVNDLGIVDRNGDQRLSFRFPDTDARFAPDADDRTYSGPGTIAVTQTGDPLPCHLATTRCKGQSGLVACIDDFFANDGTCQTQVAMPTFGGFTALPVPNDFQMKCFDTVPPCDPQSPDEFRIAIDAAGNALVPIDWRGILVQQNQVPVPRLLSATIGPSAVPITVPGESFVASYTPEGGILPPIFEPQYDIGSPSGVINLFGSADAPYTVLRLARRSESFQQCGGGVYDGLPCNQAADCPGACASGINAGQRCEDDDACPSSTCGAPGTCGVAVCASGSRAGQACNSDKNCPGGECGPALFDLAALAGAGPVIVQRFGEGICQEEVADTCALIDPCVSGPCVNYAMQAQNPVPLEGLEQSADVFAFSLNEGVDGVQRNGDGDTLDTVVTLRDRESGVGQPLGAPAGCAGFSGTPEGRAVVRAHEPPFSFPAVATEGDVLAFLESEAGSAHCFMNGDGDADDTILRVFERNPAGGAPTEVTAGFNPPLAADTALLLNDRSIAVSNGRVFFRSPEDGAADITTVRVSVAANGDEGDNFSIIDVMSKVFSHDGRFVTFNGGAGNFVTPDGGGRDIFVHDRDADEDGVYDETDPGAIAIERMTQTAMGVQANGGSVDQSISANGRYVVFTTNATNLGASAPCTHGVSPIVCDSIVIKDRVTGAVELVSVDSSGTPGNGDSRYPSTSADGRFVAFYSRSSNLVANDTNTCGPFTNPGECLDVFVRDRCESNDTAVPGCTPSTTRVSVTAGGAQVNAFSTLVMISDDGGFVVFQSDGALVPGDTNGTTDIYRSDLATGAIERASPGTGPLSEIPSISADGRYVAFDTTGALLPADTNGTFDIYVRDMRTGSLDLISVSSEGILGDDQSFYPQLSADGRYVAFTSRASNLVPGDTNTCGVFVNPGQCQDAFVHDRLTGVTRRASLASDGAQPTELISFGSISGDGRSVAFATVGDNLLGPGGDTNVLCDANNDLILDNCSDVFVRTVDPTDTAGDRSGDGDVNDTILDVIASATATLTALCPADLVAVGGGASAFLRPEAAGAATDLETPAAGVAGCPAGTPVAGGISLNADGDPDDDVAHFWPGMGSVQNLGRAAVDIDLSALCADGHACRTDGDCVTGPCTATWVAALVSEGQQNAADLNGDGDADDDVLHVHRVGDPPTAWTNVGEAADALETAGNLVAFITPEVDQSEKRNGDPDLNDRVVQVYDAAAGKLTNVKQAAEELVFGAGAGACTEGPVIAFRTNEAAQNADLNEDGDLLDDVLQVWSKGTGLINTKQPIRPCLLEACDPRAPYRILDGKVKFLTFECDQGGSVTASDEDEMEGCAPGGTDLNGDGDAGDLILQQFEVCTQKITIVGPVDEDAGAVNDPLSPQPDQPVLITKAGRCYEGMTQLLVPASCLDDGECPDGATCEDESIVATFREVTTRDIVLQPPKALAIKIGAGTATASKTLKVKLYSADPRGSGQPIPVRLTVADGDCPPGTVVGLPDLDSRTDGVQDSVLLVAAKTAKAVVTLQLAAADFATHNAKAPARCRLELSATILSEDNEDPTPRNNVATVELNVIDLNDTGSTATHESVIASAKPLKLKVGTTGTTAKNVKVTLTNADFLPTAEAGHDVIVTADDGDCPAGTVGAPVPASSLVGGGGKATVVVPVTATGAAFNTPNKKAPSRCTAVITATTDVMGNVEPDASNNTTHLVIDVVDKAD